MIPAQKSAVFYRLFWIYLRWSLKRSFGSLRAHLPDTLRHCRGPLLMIGNHHTWWDGFFILALNELILKRTMYVMMTEEQMKRFMFLRRLGGFGVDHREGKDALSVFRYTTGLLENDPNALVVIFPSGVMTPYGDTPSYKEGFARIAALVPGVQIVPCALKATHIDGQYPDVFIRCGEPTNTQGMKSGDIFINSTQRLDSLIASQERLVLKKDFADYTVFFRGRAPVSERYAAVKEQVTPQ